ncbi:MAG: arginase family protein [Bdellovibrionaceae bacterium]|nr:arginase family protein [Bdellovibrionales bacterium]MCB9254333.1 arginase family protein [Pseudobdellovibrionaceae bacterium]
MSLSAQEKLRLYLRPAGRGIYTPSSGAGHAKPMQRLLYGTEVAAEAEKKWQQSLDALKAAAVVLLGVPSDTGAGVLRGANFGPLGIRHAYLKKFGSYPRGVCDIGDVLCVPQLLHDEMLSSAQIAATRAEIYPGKTDLLPVSPLSMAEAALLTVAEVNPKAKLALLGGDHSVSWPAMLWCDHLFPKTFGVVHFDAHTDLLESRLGIKYCYATWAFHAQALMPPQHLVQLGVRASAKKKAHWTEKYPIQQFWASEIPFQEASVVDRVCQHFEKLGCEHIYVSNDIDGTDISAAPATGTPEAEGLRPEFVHEVIQALGKRFEVIGGDVVEVAPPLSGQKDFENEKTSILGADYLNTLFQSML